VPFFSRNINQEGEKHNLSCTFCSKVLPAILFGSINDLMRPVQNHVSLIMTQDLTWAQTFCRFSTRNTTFISTQILNIEMRSLRGGFHVTRAGSTDQQKIFSIDTKKSTEMTRSAPTKEENVNFVLQFFLCESFLFYQMVKWNVFYYHRRQY